MELKIKRVSIENFRKIVAPTTYEFVDGLNVFAGKNGLGKTTILSAITWAIFGYDLYGSNVSHFSIYPVIEDEKTGEPIDRTDLKPTVEVEFDNEIVLKRVFAKDTTQCYIGNYDGMQKLNFTKYTTREYNAKIEQDICNKEEFEMLSNLEKIPRLKQDKLKELIFSLVGGIEDDVILANGDYSLIESDIRLHGVEKTETTFKQTRTSVKQAIVDANAVIKHNTDTKAQYLVDQDKDSLIKRKEFLDNQVAEYEKETEANKEISVIIAAHNQKITDIDSNINNLTIHMDQVGENVLSYKKLYTENAFDAEQERNKDLDSIVNKDRNYNTEIGRLQVSNTSIQYRIDSNKRLFDALTKDNERLIANGTAITKETITIKESCDTCGQELPEDLKSSAKDSMVANRKQRADAVMADIMSNKTKKANYTSLIEADEKLIEGNNESIKDYESKIAALEDERTDVNNKEYLSEDETPNQTKYREQYESYEADYAKFEETIATAKAEKVELEKVVLPVLKELNTPTELIQEKETIAISLSSITNCEETIITKQANLDKYADDLNVIEEKIQLIIQFKTSKSQLITERIQSHFNIVEFITSEKTKAGDTVEVFKLGSHGVEYDELSTGEKIKVSFDLVTGVQKLKGLILPIIIDGLEGVTDFDYIPTQVIAAFVDPKLPSINLNTVEKTVTISTQPEKEVEKKSDAKEIETEGGDSEQTSLNFGNVEA